MKINLNYDFKTNIFIIEYERYLNWKGIYNFKLNC